MESLKQSNVNAAAQGVSPPNAHRTTSPSIGCRDARHTGAQCCLEAPLVVQRAGAAARGTQLSLAFVLDTAWRPALTRRTLCVPPRRDRYPGRRVHQAVRVCRRVGCCALP